MKAAVIREPGATPEYADFGEPIVSEGHVQAELVAAGIHPVVRSLAAGLHYGSAGKYPLVPGVDAVARIADGTLVYTGYIQPPYGTLAERMAIPAATQFVLPEGAQPERVAGGINPGMSSWLPLRTRRDEAGPLGTVLVIGATGMAGLLAVQNARLLGADRVVAAGRDAAGLQRAASYGASTATLDGDRQFVAAALAEALAGDSPGLVLDFVWGPPAEAAFAALTQTGMNHDGTGISYVQIGSVAGAEAAMPAALLRSRRIRISGHGAGSAPVQQVVTEIPAYLQLIASGQVDVPVRVFPLSACAQAWDASDVSGSRAVVIPD